MALVVRGMRELTRTFQNAPKDVNRAYRDELKTVAEPVRMESEQLATSSIRRMTPAWSKMKTGVTTRLVYVAPRKRGIGGRGDDPRRRPNLGTLLMDRALQPALERNRARVEQDFDQMLDRLVTKWDQDGP